MGENEYSAILAKLENALKRLEAEAGEHAAIHKAIEKNADSIRVLGADIKHLRDEQRQIKETHEPIADFFADIHAVSRIGRTIRAIIGWVALVIGSIAMVWLAVADQTR
jgi:hypothetical protein